MLINLQCFAQKVSASLSGLVQVSWVLGEGDESSREIFLWGPILLEFGRDDDVESLVCSLELN